MQIGVGYQNKLASLELGLFRSTWCETLTCCSLIYATVHFHRYRRTESLWELKLSIESVTFYTIYYTYSDFCYKKTTTTTTFFINHHSTYYENKNEIPSLSFIFSLLQLSIKKWETLKWRGKFNNMAFFCWALERICGLIPQDHGKLIQCPKDCEITRAQVLFPSRARARDEF